MNGVKELILSFASSRKEFSTDELWDWLSQNGDIVRNTVNITLSRLVSKGKSIFRAGFFMLSQQGNAKGGNQIHL